MTKVNDTTALPVTSDVADKDSFDEFSGYVPFDEGVAILNEFYDRKHPVYIYSLLRKKLIPAKKKGNYWYIQKNFMEEAAGWRKSVYSLKDLCTELSLKAGIPNDTGLSRSILRVAKGQGVDSEYKTLFGEFVYISRDNEEVFTKAEACAFRRIKDSDLIKAEKAAALLNVSEYILQKIIKDGKIETEYKNDGLMVNLNSLMEFKNVRDSYIGIYDLLEIVISETKLTTTFDLSDSHDRIYFYNLIKRTTAAKAFISWADSGFHGDRRNAFYFPKHMEAEMRDILITELKAFGLNKDRLPLLMKDPYWKDCPNTQKLFSGFKRNKNIGKITALAELLIEGKKEIQEYTNDDITALLERAKEKDSTTYEDIAVKFVRYIKERYSVAYTADLIKKKPAPGIVNNSTLPYKREQFYALSYMVLNEDGIKKYDLIEKALDDPIAALIWLKTLWTYCGAWRNSDFLRLPMIDLPYEDDIVEHMIRNGDYGKSARLVAMMLESECNGRYTRPHKTENEQSGHYRIISIPESAKEIYGIAYSIVRIHFKDALPEKPLRPYDYIRVFGNDYRKIFGESAFSIRRANKTFLSLIREGVEEGSKTENRVIGYAVASLARGHSYRGNHMPGSTETYIKNRLDDLSPSDTLMYLFESGTCGFIPFMLFQAIYGERFSNLDLKGQIEVIKASGLEAYEADQKAACIRREYIRSGELIRSIFSGNEGHTEKMKNVLADIIFLHSPSKTEHVQCLMTAVREACPYQGRTNCFGCPYAVLENAFIFQAMDEIRKIKKRADHAVSKEEYRKDYALLTNIYLPPLLAALETLKTVYGIDIDGYKTDLMEILERKGDVNERISQYKTHGEDDIQNSGHKT